MIQYGLGLPHGTTRHCGNNVGAHRPRLHALMRNTGRVLSRDASGCEQAELFDGVLDCTGEYPYTGEVLVQGNRIKSITKGSSRFSSVTSSGGQTVIDGAGATLMPGMIDAHLHLSWNNAPGIDPIQRMPPEEHMLWTAQMAKLVIDAGFSHFADEFNFEFIIAHQFLGDIALR